jgi:intracellular multiplication protein IcmC
MECKKHYLMGVSVLLLAPPAMSMTSLTQLLVNFSQNVPIIEGIIRAFAFLVGSFFILRALIKLKIYGEMRTMLSSHGRLNQVLLLLFAGVLLIYLQNLTIPVMLSAVFGDGSIKGLAYNDTLNLSEQVQYAAKRIMQFIGLAAVFRGIVQLASYQEGGRHPMGKSITHILSGIMAVNIQYSIDLLHRVFGL